MHTSKILPRAYASCLDEDDVLTVAVGDDPYAPESYFIIARLDEDDRCVDQCIGFQNEVTEYELAAAIQAVQLDSGSLSITLNEEASRRAGARRFRAELAPSTELPQLRAHLQAIFSGSMVTLTLP